MTTGLAADETAATRPPVIGRSKLADAELYVRGAETLLASWEQYARGATGAAVRCFAGVATAVFPNDPERGVYNNALLERGLAASERADAISAMEAAYQTAGVTRFAAWVHESDAAMRSALERRGYSLDEVTRAMGMTLDDIRLPRPNLELGSADWSEHLRLAGMPRGFLSDADPCAFHVLAASLRGENVSTAIAFDFAGDCGIYNVGTLEPGSPPWTGYRVDRDPPARCPRTGMPDSEPAVDGDGRARVCRRRRPRPRPDPRVRPSAELIGARAHRHPVIGNRHRRGDERARRALRRSSRGRWDR